MKLTLTYETDTWNLDWHMKEYGHWCVKSYIIFNQDNLSNWPHIDHTGAGCWKIQQQTSLHQESRKERWWDIRGLSYCTASAQTYPTPGRKQTNVSHTWQWRKSSECKQTKEWGWEWVCVFICLGSLRKWECMRMYMLMCAFYPLTCVPHSTNKGNRFTLYRQSSAPEIMRLLTAFQSTVSMTPSWAFHCTKQTIHNLEKITILTKAFTNLPIELPLLTWAFAKLCVITWICFTTASQN